LHTIGGPDIRRASDRIASDFLKLLEQQFQQSDKRRPIELRYPAQFAERMNIHVNHLNRALTETLRESTTQFISHWFLSEAKTRLDETDMNIAEIAYALGFTEASHFSNFFKKRMRVSPTEFRKRIWRD
jgi:AraC-like DNA-binding protein